MSKAKSIVLFFASFFSIAFVVAGSRILFNKDAKKIYYNNAFKALYDKYYNDLNEKKYESSIYTEFLNNMNQDYIKSTRIERIIIDYIAGMTDHYAVTVFSDIYIPKAWSI